MVSQRAKSQRDPSDTVSKLDLVLETIRSIEEKQSIQFSSLIGEISSLRAVNEDNRRAIRGSNGDLGLVGTMARQSDRIDRLEEVVTELSGKVTTLSKEISTERTERSGKLDHATVKDLVKEATDEDHVVRWSTIRDKTFWPLLMAVIFAVLYLIGQAGLFPHP